MIDGIVFNVLGVCAGHAEGYMSSPERGAARTPYEDPYYTQYLGPAASRPNIAPIIDEEVRWAID